MPLSPEQLAIEFYLGIQTSLTCPDISVDEYKTVIAHRIRERDADALREVERLTLKWSDIPPVKTGWYWWRDSESMPRIYEVWQHSHYPPLCIGSGDLIRRVDTLEGQWAGPIGEPQ